jgi:tRNA 2-selenouridine synthase
MSERVKLWQEDYRHFERDPAALLERLRFLRPLVGAEEFGQWERFACQSRMPELFQRLMEAHYDPAYARSIQKHYPDVKRSPCVDLQNLDSAALLAVARQLHLAAAV